MTRRIPLGYNLPDPRRRTNFIDSCAFDPKYFPEDGASLRIFSLYEESAIVLNIAHSTLKEVEHPHTPSWVKKAAQTTIYTNPTSLILKEVAVKAVILEVLPVMESLEKWRKMRSTFLKLRNIVDIS